jgi:hypothetical protein
MARKLTKKTLAGQAYERRQQVEEELAELRTLGQSELIKRIRGSLGGQVSSCSAEAMMALFRDGASGLLLNELVVRIQKRFASFAEHKLKARNAFSQEALQNVISAFTQALAIDSTKRCDMLDFFEVAFSNAVAGFVQSEARRERSRRYRYVSMTPEGDDETAGSDDSDAFVDVDRLPPGLTEPEREVFTEQLLSELEKLDKPLRDVAVLLALGVPKESIDPNETTIATECDIKRRAVQYRQDKIIEKLAHFKE